MRLFALASYKRLAIKDILILAAAAVRQASGIFFIKPSGQPWREMCEIRTHFDDTVKLCRKLISARRLKLHGRLGRGMLHQTNRSDTESLTTNPHAERRSLGPFAIVQARYGPEMLRQINWHSLILA